MNEQERKILYKLLLDLFVEKPEQERENQSKRSQEHEGISTTTRIKRARN